MVNAFTEIALALTWGGGATYGVDYTASATGGTLSADGRTLTLAAGATTATVTVTPLDDALYEGAETVSLTVGAGSGYTVGSPSSATGSIADNDAAPVVALTATDASGAEQGSDPIVFRVDRSANLAGDIVVGLTWSGAATYSTDYTVTVTGGTLSANGTTLTLAAGSTGATITVTPVDDAVVESAESVVLTLGSAATYVLGASASATGSIVDNDFAPVIALAVGDTSGNEFGLDPISFTVSRSGVMTGSVVVNLAWSGTATYGTDYTVTVVGGTLSANGLQLTLASGSTGATITVTPVDDTTVESTETVTLTLVAASGYVLGSTTSGTGSILDNDGSSTVSVSAADASGAEAAADPIAFTVTRTGNLWSSIVVNLGWSGTATFGTDYTVTVTGGTLSANGATLTLAPGSAQATVTLTPVDDNVAEGAETAILTLKTGTGYALGSPASATGSIADNDVATLSIADATVTEADSSSTSLSIAVTLSNPSTTSVTVTVTTVQGTALAGKDYTATTKTLTFSPGVTQLSFAVPIIGDKTIESTETFTVVLSSASGATIARGTGTVTIVDNDARLTAAGTPAAPTAAPALTAADALSTLDAARAVWAAAGADAAALAGVTIEIADLDGAVLGEADGSVVRLDANAAGWGWALTSDAGGPAGEIDLLSVLVHELGHVLGLEHADDGFMAATLAPDERLLPATIAPVALPQPALLPARAAPALVASAALAQSKLELRGSRSAGGIAVRLGKPKPKLVARSAHRR